MAEQEWGSGVQSSQSFSLRHASIFILKHRVRGFFKPSAACGKPAQSLRTPERYLTIFAWFWQMWVMWAPGHLPTAGKLFKRSAQQALYDTFRTSCKKERGDRDDLQLCKEKTVYPSVCWTAVIPGKSDSLLPLRLYTRMLSHLLFGMNGSKAGEKSRRLAGAIKHMIFVRANLADDCAVPDLPRLDEEW